MKTLCNVIKFRQRFASFVSSKYSPLLETDDLDAFSDCKIRFYIFLTLPSEFFGMWYVVTVSVSPSWSIILFLGRLS
jgi:hypothetical protein